MNVPRLLALSVMACLFSGCAAPLQLGKNKSGATSQIESNRSPLSTWQREHSIGKFNRTTD